MLKEVPRRIQGRLFEPYLIEQIDQKNKWVRLAHLLAWDDLHEKFDALYASRNGRPGIPIRCMAGLIMIAHIENLSDKKVVERWVENPYWQYFCGETHLQWKAPIDPSSLTRFRQRMGGDGVDTILNMSVKAALKAGCISKRHFKRVTVDSTAMETNVAYPTDAKLLNQSRERLVRLCKKHGIALRQSYVRVFKTMQLKVSRYAHAKQMKRLHRVLKTMRTDLGRLVRDISGKLDKKLMDSFHHELAMASRIIHQKKHDRNKLYSLHEPTTQCISKGKARQRYEFGVKVSVVTTHKGGIVLACDALKGNPYDGHTLQAALTHAQRHAMSTIEEVFVDRGYRGHKIEQPSVFMSGQKRNGNPGLRKAIQYRNTIEAHIGHMKQSGKLRKTFLKGPIGHAIHATLCGVGHNLRLIFNAMRLSPA